MIIAPNGSINGAEPLHLPVVSTALMTPQSDIFLAVAATVPVFAGLAAHSITGFIEDPTHSVLWGRPRFQRC